MKHYDEVYKKYIELLDYITIDDMSVEDFNRIVGQLVALYFCMMPSATYEQSINYVEYEINNKLTDEVNNYIYSKTL